MIVSQNLSHTFLIGWDNLQTELGNSLNLQRGLFSVWEEYQGLGLLAGNAHAADLIRQIFITLISFIAPLNLVRQVYVFLMLATGAFGAYFLLKNVFFDNRNDFVSRMLSLTAGFFYLFNLSTIQTFYAPFEPFIAHFGFLPWLILSSILYLRKNSGKNFAFFVIINILAMSQSQVPTIFLVYFLILLTILLIHLLSQKTRQTLNSGIKIILTTLVINAFWLLPFIFFVVTNSQVALLAKINQMSTETVYLQNKAFGGITDVMLLKGFWFNNVDPNLQGISTYMLEPWRNYFSNLVINLIGYLLFAVALVGALFSIKQKKAVNTIFLLLFIGAFTLLASATFPFSIIDLLLSKLPLLHAVFRFPFTKFSIILSLCYSVFFVLGIYTLVNYIGILRKNLNLSIFFACLFSVLLLLVFAFPIFQGKLFYAKEKINLPKEYFQVFDYFKQQDQNTRIANLPQPTFWGWEFYNWGYGGSGFLWYGIKQPLLDRAFDVWSGTNENYYWELANTIYTKNPLAFRNVLNKYQVNWLLLDKNLIYPSSPLSLSTQEIYSLINENSSIQKAASFGNIDIYKVGLKDDPKSFVFSSPLNSANGYSWGNFDQAYTDLGNYQNSNEPANFYPLRSLFSNKSQSDLAYKMVDEENDILLSVPLSPTGSGAELNLKAFTESEEIIPASFTFEKTQNNFVLSVVLQTPEISIVNGGKKTIVYANSQKIPLVSIPINVKGDIELNINGIKDYKFNSNSTSNLGVTFLSTVQDNIIVIKNQDVSQIITIKASQIFPLFKQANIPLPTLTQGAKMEVEIPKVTDNYLSFKANPDNTLVNSVKNCDNFNNQQYLATLAKVDGQTTLKLQSELATACVNLDMPNLIHNQGYALLIKNANQTGRNLHFWLSNDNTYYSPMDTYLSAANSLTTDTYILSPQEEFGRGYSLHFENMSINHDSTINYLGSIELYPIPYNFLTTVTISNKQVISSLQANYQAVMHPNESLYLIKNITPANNSPIILSQSFNPGWKAYAINSLNFWSENFPFLFGNEVKNHVLVNNWENGWILSNKEQSNLVIVYLPQYLEYLGFIILLLPIIVVFLRILASKRPRKRAVKLDSEAGL
ncbi:MAG: hypothetical protein ABSD69_00450 [Candidatus Levyibacteriota bacterium]